ncbi:sensor histidine kinase [Psychrobacter sp. I-STPA10]|uniref:sensor histidine kinase n=1 Tax=Psychrobacter sp. I-STPA10 TaxID=2585769 RepID=UPI001E29E74E|nr:HAMP domain-containing sensor histidine kinase [Psychrobacter sp. I-STPA10]
MSRFCPKNLSWNIKKIVIISTTVLYLVAVGTYIYHELIDNYRLKKIEIKNLSQILAENASIPDGISVVGQQVTYLLEQDPTLQSISFYSINQSLSFSEENKPDWQVVLQDDIVSFHQPVTSNIDSSNKEELPFIIPNQSLLGYINVSLDLDRLRQQWFVRHSLILLALLLCYLIWLVWVIWWISRPINSINSLSNYADEINDRYNPLTNRVFKDHTIYVQLNKLHQSLELMEHLYQQAQSEVHRMNNSVQAPSTTDLLALQQSSFQSMITHELKTSLNAIFGGLQLLDNQYTSQEQEDAIGIIRKGSTDLELILSQIIQLNKIEKGQMKVEAEKIEPLKILGSLIQNYEKLSQDKGIEVISRIHHMDTALKGDHQKIYSVLDALLNNAVKFTKVGSITVESFLDKQDSFIYWRIEITDTGIGIEANNLKDIFLPFFQVDPSMSREFEGVGVGLGVAQRLTKLMDGKLEVDSVYGKGSTFRLLLPLQIWMQNEDNQILSGKRIIFYTVKPPSYFPAMITQFGAQVDEFSEIDALMNHIFTTSASGLMISSQVKVVDAMMLAEHIRQLESNHRLLIIYYYDDLSQKQMDELLASGVDICQTTQLSHKAQAQAIKSWLE